MLDVANGGAMRVYLDFDTIKTVGGNPRVWVMYDYTNDAKTSNGPSYRTARSLVEFACARGESRTLAESATSGNMGAGVVVSSDMDIENPSRWTALIPSSIGS